jgi:hypothetical protein
MAKKSKKNEFGFGDFDMPDLLIPKLDMNFGSPKTKSKKKKTKINNDPFNVNTVKESVPYKTDRRDGPTNDGVQLLGDIATAIRRKSKQKKNVVKTEEQKIIDHKKRTEEIKKEYLKQLKKKIDKQAGVVSRSDKIKGKIKGKIKTQLHKIRKPTTWFVIQVTKQKEGIQFERKYKTLNQAQIAKGGYVSNGFAVIGPVAKT